MSVNCPADNTADLANTAKEMMARLTTIEGHFEAQTKINDKLQAENVEFKAGKAKQDKELFEVRGTCAELKDKYDAVKADNDQLKSRVDELEANQTPPLTLSSPTPLHPDQRPRPIRNSCFRPPLHPSTSHLPRPLLETCILAFR